MNDTDKTMVPDITVAEKSNAAGEEYPQIALHSDTRPAAQVISDFLDWLSEKPREYEIAKWRPTGNWMLPISEGREKLLADYFGIDLNKLERERRAMLKAFAAPRDGGRE